MKQITIGLLLTAVASLAFAQQQTPDCQDVAFAIGYPRDTPAFATRTEVSHARDKDASKINRTPVPLTFAELKSKKYPGQLIPEAEGVRLPPDELTIYEIKGVVNGIGCGSRFRGSGFQTYNLCESAAAGAGCICLSLSPPECVGDSPFSAEILATWQKNLTGQVAVGSTYTVQGVGYWCCENTISMHLKPVFSIVPSEPGSDTGGGQPVAPPPDVTVNLPASVSQQPVVLGNGQSNEFNVTTSPVTGFNGPVALSIGSDALETDNFSVSISPAAIPAPGAGTAKVTINTSATTFPRDYHVTIFALANDKTFLTSFVVSVTCDPPVILGIDQPRDQTVNSGVRATFQVKAVGTGPFQYQWYRGRRGSTLFPVAGANTDRLEVTGTDDLNLYWVRLSNACGSVDSTTVSVAPSRLRAVRR